MTRLSVVKSLKIRSLLISGISQVGDSYAIVPRSNVLAVARQLPFFLGKEDHLSQYPVFSRPISLPQITENVQLTITNEHPLIRTGNISIHGVSTSGIVHIGSTKHIDAETRVKHMRQFLFPPEALQKSTD